MPSAPNPEPLPLKARQPYPLGPASPNPLGPADPSRQPQRPAAPTPSYNNPFISPISARCAAITRPASVRAAPYSPFSFSTVAISTAPS